MLNLFTYISTKPEGLLVAEDPVGPADAFILKYSKKCSQIIFAWGSFEGAQRRAKEIKKSFKGFMLIENKDGSPRHPLYVPYNVKPILVKDGPKE